MSGTPEGLEIARAHRLGIGRAVVLLARALAGVEQDAGAPSPAQGKAVGERGRLDSGKGHDPQRQLLEEGDTIPGLGIAQGRQIDGGGEHALRLEADVDRAEPPEALQHQPAAHEEDDAERDLGHEKPASETEGGSGDEAALDRAQRLVRPHAGDESSGEEGGQEGGEHGQHLDTGQHTGIEVGFGGAHLGGSQGRCRSEHPEATASPRSAASEGEKSRLEQGAPQGLGAARAQGHAHRDLTGAAERRTSIRFERFRQAMSRATATAPRSTSSEGRAPRASRSWRGTSRGRIAPFVSGCARASDIAHGGELGPGLLEGRALAKPGHHVAARDRRD